MNTTLQASVASGNHVTSPNFAPAPFDQKIIDINKASNELSFWGIIGRAVFVGPLIGGLPYLWAILPIPFAYLIGAVPALIGGACFALWLRAGRMPTTMPSTMQGAAFGALFGAVGCIVAAIGLLFISTPPASFEAARLALEQARDVDRYQGWLFVLPHGIFAGFMLGGYLLHQENKKIAWVMKLQETKK